MKSVNQVPELSFQAINMLLMLMSGNTWDDHKWACTSVRLVVVCSGLTRIYEFMWSPNITHPVIRVTIEAECSKFATL